MSLYGVRQLVDGTRAVRAGTIQIARDIPESHYALRPSPGSRSVAETLVHIAWLAAFDRSIHGEPRVESLETFDFAAAIRETQAEEAHPRSKEAIVDLLRTEGDRWISWVEQLPAQILAEPVGTPGGGSMTRFDLLLGTREHEVHHRAQLMVMERMLGIVPHPTRNFLAMVEAADQEIATPSVH